MKMHSCKNLVLCYYFKYFILPKKLIQESKVQLSFNKTCHFKSNAKSIQ